jgi:hypothetical protein
MDGFFAAFWIIMLCIYTWATWKGGIAAGMEDMEIEAVKAGVAEYRLDENFERQFHWKTNKP